MNMRAWLLLIPFLCLIKEICAQHLYYKNPDIKTIMAFRDSANRVSNLDSGSVLKHQFNYILKFYPKMEVKDIRVKYVKSKTIADIKPNFGSIFKLPEQRSYTVYFSKQTGTTLDSVLLDNLSFNAQLGLIANQVSIIEDMSTGGFFNFLSWYFKHLGRKGRRNIVKEAQLKTLEMGLGHQLLALNREYDERLQISNWLNTKGYANYFKHYRGQLMKPQKVINLMNDTPVYVSHNYK